MILNKLSEAEIIACARVLTEIELIIEKRCKLAFKLGFTDAVQRERTQELEAIMKTCQRDAHRYKKKHFRFERNLRRLQEGSRRLQHAMALSSEQKKAWRQLKDAETPLEDLLLNLLTQPS